MAKKKKPSLVAESNRREVLRKQQAAQKAAQSRNRRIVIAAALVMAVVIVGVFTAVIAAQVNRGAGGTVVPPNASADKAGIVVNPQVTKAPHTVAIYLDYQCTACKQLEDTYGAQLEAAAAAGSISLEYRALNILKTADDSSLRAAVAAACADTVGQYAAYHNQIFAHQPTAAGVGYTATQLRTDFAQAAGITGDLLTGFQKCYDNRDTQQFVTQATELSAKAGVTGTPMVMVDGTLAANAGTALTTVLAAATPTATPTPTPGAATPTATGTPTPSAATPAATVTPSAPAPTPTKS